jgi:hypothetical protein
MSKRAFSAVAVVGVVASGLLLAPLGPPAVAAGSVSLTALGVAYTQDFAALALSGMSTVTPDGWDFAESGTNANTTYTAGTGSASAGDTYSFGATTSTERSFGGLQSGSLVPTIGVSLTNATGGVITSLAVGYTGEQWRLGTAGRPDRLDVQLSTNATSLTTGTWVDADALDFAAPVSAGTAGALDGNATANRTPIAATITGLSVLPGATVWLRWVDLNATGADDGLAVDDVSITPSGVPVDPAPTVVATTPADGATGVLPSANLTVTFSEPVNTRAGALTLACTAGGPATLAVTGGPVTFTLDPAADLQASDTCALTVVAAAVTDQDTDDPLDAMAADVVVTFTTAGPDAAPAVASTVPADGASGVAVGQSIVVNFSEPVNVTGAWFTIACAASGTVAATVTGGPVSYTLDPVTDLAFGEACTLTIVAANVSDQDGNDPPDNLVVDFTAGFATEPDPCTLTFTPAYAIQRSGPAAAITGPVTTQGVVVGDYEYPGSGSTASHLRGFYVQDLNGDGDPATSDALFVFNGNGNSVALGDVVRVSGNAAEFQEQTQISASSIRRCGTAAVAPVDVTFPVASPTFLERYEGMLVRLPQDMHVTEHFQLGRFGQVVVSAGSRLQQPTNVVAPGAPALALQAQNDLRKIIIDDALQAQNPDPIVFGRGGQALSASNTLRGGDIATNTVGVMTYTWAGNAASGNAYRVRPINALGGFVNFTAANLRPTTTPDVGGNVQVVGMNLLNYFNTFDGLPDSVDNCRGGTLGAPTDCRGADTAAEFARQVPKTVAAILALDPDVLGVNELENDGYGADSALQHLVDQLNAIAGAGTYAFIDADARTGQVDAMGSDAIRVAQIYKPSVVTPVGQTAVLNSVAFVNGGDAVPRGRPSLAQAYRVNANGATFIVDVNHFKSKGSACDAPDAGDGQGNCNVVRTNAATALVDWLATDPTGTGDPDVLLVGDYNSYAKEDPIGVVEQAGYTNLIAARLGPDAYSYVFDGQWGYLDHALGSPSIVGQVAGVADYHINADEPSVLDYNTDFKTPNLQTVLYAPDQYRASDHDPVIVGLALNDPPTVDAGGPYSAAEGGSVALLAAGSDPNLDPLSYEWDLDGDGTFETPGVGATFSAAAIDGPASRIVAVRVTDPSGLSATDTATVEITNEAPSVTAAFARATTTCGTANAELRVTFGDPAAADTHTAVVDWGDGRSQTVSAATSPLTLPHTYARAGRYTAQVTVTDDDGGAATATASITVDYITPGILPPIAQDGSSVFRARATIPVWTFFLDCNGSLPSNLAPTITVTEVGSPTPSLSGTMAFTLGLYRYHINARALPNPTGTYRITITVPASGQTLTAEFRLRR